MKSLRGISASVLFLSVLSTSSTSGQTPFEVPLTFSNGEDSMTVYFGFLPKADFCIIQSDSFNGHREFEIPPLPPANILEVRFVWPRLGSGNPCFGLGALVDFRPVRSGVQVDSFRVQAQRGVGASMIFSWPAGLSAHFLQLTLRYFNGTGNVNVDMLTDTSVDVTNADGFISAWIFPRGAYGPTPVNATDEEPNNFALFQNYPNPFNPETRIRFWIPEAGFTTLMVYDGLGREVATLVNEVRRSGEYNVEWDASRFPSGVYYYRILARDHVQTRKLILVK